MKRELLLPRTRAKLPPRPDQTSSQLLSARGMWLSTVNFDTVRAMSTRLPRSISCRWAMPRGALEDSYVSDQALVSGGAKVGGLPATPVHATHAPSEAVFPRGAEESVNARCLPVSSLPRARAGVHLRVPPQAEALETIEHPWPRPWWRETPLLRAPVCAVQRNVAAPAEAALDVTQLGKRDVVAVPTWSASPRWGG